MVVKLFDELGPRYAKRNGGYLRILKFGFRQGDNAPMALVELMDRPEPKEEGAKEEGGLSDQRRSQRERKPTLGSAFSIPRRGSLRPG